MKRMCFLHGLKCLVIGALVVAGLGFVVKLLWNGLLPDLFGWHPIGFGQAVGLLVLARILIGGFRGRHCGPHWRRRMWERWEQMSPEEREKFHAGLGRCCGFSESSSSEETPPSAGNQIKPE